MPCLEATVKVEALLLVFGAIPMEENLIDSTELKPNVMNWGLKYSKCTIGSKEALN